MAEREFHSKSQTKRVATQTGTVPCDICGKRIAVTPVEDGTDQLFACAQCADDLKEWK